MSPWSWTTTWPSTRSACSSSTTAGRPANTVALQRSADRRLDRGAELHRRRGPPEGELGRDPPTYNEHAAAIVPFHFEHLWPYKRRSSGAHRAPRSTRIDFREASIPPEPRMPIARFLATPAGARRDHARPASPASRSSPRASCRPTPPGSRSGSSPRSSSSRLYREEQGLNRPVLERYVTWVGDVVQGDWGTSAASKQPGHRRRRAAHRRGALTLALVAMLIAVPLAFMLGVFAGQRGGKRSTSRSRSATLFLNSLPEFVVGARAARACSGSARAGSRSSRAAAALRRRLGRGRRPTSCRC